MFQYFPYLQAQGIEVDVEPLFDDAYLEALYSNKSRLGSVIKAYFHRFVVLLFAKKYDFLWVEKELFPWTPWFIEKMFFLKMNTPYIVDYDDAIFHQYDLHRNQIVRNLLGKKCDMVMRSSGLVIAGNSYLAERAVRAGATRVQQIPTVVSQDRFVPAVTDNSPLVIGWIGSMSTAVYLEKLKPLLKELKTQFSFVLRIVGAEVNWEDLPVECVQWSESLEVQHIQSFDIGVMPLKDSPWERGKCGFKLIQYMACGKPVVADAVGANIDIVESGKGGFLVSADDDWRLALSQLLKDGQLRASMGIAGRQRFVENYSLETAQGELLKSFFSLKVKVR